MWSSDLAQICMHLATPNRSGLLKHASYSSSGGQLQKSKEHRKLLWRLNLLVSWLSHFSCLLYLCLVFMISETHRTFQHWTDLRDERTLFIAKLLVFWLDDSLTLENGSSLMMGCRLGKVFYTTMHSKETVHVIFNWICVRAGAYWSAEGCFGIIVMETWRSNSFYLEGLHSIQLWKNREHAQL